jgi:uncharacterized membrane protein
MPIGWPRGYVVSILATTALLGLALLAPWLAPGWRFGLMEFFSTLCHQDPARSFIANGHPLAVCHRCIGIYVGLVSGALVYPAVHGALEKRMRAVVIGLSVPMAVDWGISVLGLWANTPLSRVSTGALFGLALGLALTLGLVDIFKRTSRVQPRATSCETTS